MQDADGRRALGRLGETLAARALEARGYRIVARNVRAGGVEIDLIVQHHRTLAFVEVKARRGGRQGSPEDAVDARKRARLLHGARAWLHEHRVRGRRIRFDVVAVEWDGGDEPRIRHWPDAFDASDG